MGKTGRLLQAACIAKAFYEQMFELTGGCDHSVGICECGDRRDYEQLVAVLREFEAGTPGVVVIDNERFFRRS